MSENDPSDSQFPRLRRGRQALDELLVASFLSGSTQSEAARNARCSLKTVKRKLQTSEFQERLAAAKKELLNRTIRRAASLAFKSLGVLEELATSGEDASIRLRAATVLIETSVNMAAMQEFEERLSALETDRQPKKMRYVS